MESYWELGVMSDEELGVMESWCDWEQGVMESYREMGMMESYLGVSVMESYWQMVWWRAGCDGGLVVTES